MMNRSNQLAALTAALLTSLAAHGAALAILANNTASIA